MEDSTGVIFRTWVHSYRDSEPESRGIFQSIWGSVYPRNTLPHVSGETTCSTMTGTGWNAVTQKHPGRSLDFGGATRISSPNINYKPFHVAVHWKTHGPLGLMQGCGTLLEGYLHKVGKAEQKLLLWALPSITCSLLFSRLEGCFAEGSVVMRRRFKREDVMKNKCKGLEMRRERLKNY